MKTESAPPPVATAGPDHRAFAILVHQHHRRLLGYALSLVATEADAEDIVQEAFVVAYRRLGDFDPERDFGAWVRGIVRNKALEWRRRRKEPLVSEAALAILEARHSAWDRVEADGHSGPLDALRHCLGKLDDLLQRTTRLFYFENRSCREVAAATDCHESAARKRLQRAREQLADCVQRQTGAQA